MHKNLFYELVEDIDGHFDEAGEEPLAALETLRHRLKLDHVAYLGINLPIPIGSSRSDAYIVTTYSKDWVARYVSKSYVRIDPVVRAGLQGILPVDWADLPSRRDRKVAAMFGEAAEHGLGTEGLSIPIHGIHGELAMFSVNSALARKDWLALRREIIRELQVFAYYFHTRVLEAQGVLPPASIELSDRERECLQWAAAGKSAWETAEIIGVRESTVNFFLEQCRTKLDAANKVQAVAKAVRLSII